MVDAWVRNVQTDLLAVRVGNVEGDQRPAVRVDHTLRHTADVADQTVDRIARVLSRADYDTEHQQNDHGERIVQTHDPVVDVHALDLEQRFQTLK